MVATNNSSNHNINSHCSSSNSTCNSGHAVKSLVDSVHRGRKTASPKKSKKVASPPSTTSLNGGDDDLRPRRRASQTYFFKYQLANNPLKAEEEDLKLALLASLNDCDASNSNFDFDATNSLSTPTPTSSTAIANSNGKAQKKTKNQSKPNQNGSPTSIKKHKKNSNFDLTSVKKQPGHGDSVQVVGQASKPKANHANAEKEKKMMLIKLEKNKLKEKAHKLIEAAKKDSYKRNNIPLKKTAGRPRSSSLPLSPDSELRKLKKMSKKRRLLHLARKNPNFFHQSSLANSALIGTASSNGTFTAYGNASSTATNSAYFPYDPLQKREPLDENYLRKYKPETGVFLTFICFRKTAPHYPTSSSVDRKCIPSPSMTSPALSPTPTPTTNGISTTKTSGSPSRSSPRQKIGTQSPIQSTPDHFESKVSSNPRPGLLSVRIATASGSSRRKTRAAHESPQQLSSPGQESLFSTVSTAGSPAERRHSIRQSPRLATRQSIRQQQKHLAAAASAAGPNSVRKYLISENDLYIKKNINCNNSIISQLQNNTSNSMSTAYDNSIDYEEDVKRASIALEDMAQEISHQQQAISNSSSSSDTNNNNYTTTKSKSNSKTNYNINHHDRDELAQNQFPSKATNDLSNCHHTRKSNQDNKHASALDKDSAIHSNHNSLSLSPFKNNKHLVKGLMTREFAGAFADEETIFESISHHKL